nr:hypothetical protein [Tanacetum cinerariifolium]
MGDENPICTLGDYSKPSHEVYKYTIELPIGNNMVPLRSGTIRLVQNGCSFHEFRSEDLNQHLKDYLKLLDSLDLDGLTPKSPSSWHRPLAPSLNFFMTMSIPSQDEPLINRPVYCMEDPEQDFVEYISSLTDETRESLELGKNGSPFVQGEVPAKMEDPGLFTLPCRLGEPFNTLVDLGSCVNIILLYLFQKLNIGLLEETDHVFRLADRTKSYPVGIVKYVEVHIGKLNLLNDFYMIDIKKDSETLLLVGRGFLATANAVIDRRMTKIAVGEGITSPWMAFEGNTRNLGSFGEETDEITDLHQILEEVMLTEHGDGIASIKQRRRDLFSDGFWNLEIASGRLRKLAFVCISVDTSRETRVHRKDTIGRVVTSGIRITPEPFGMVGVNLIEDDKSLKGRAILDVMVWRHPDVAIDDPRPAAGTFNMANKNRFCDPVLWGADRNVMGIHDFLCLPGWTVAEVSTSGAASSLVAKRTRFALAQSSSSTTRPSLFAGDDDESADNDDACVEIPLVTPLRSFIVIPSSGNQGGSSVAPTAEDSNTRDSQGKGIMVDDVAAPSGGVSRQIPSSRPTPSFRDVFGNAIHMNFFPFFAGPYYTTYPENGVAGNYEFTREEWDAPHRPTFEILTKDVFKDPDVSRLNDKLATFDASFAKSKAKGKERKKKIKSFTKSLDNLHFEVARLSAALNKATILEAKRDDEILVQGELLSLAANAGFERSFPFVAQTDYAFLNKIFEYAAKPLSVILQLKPENLVHPTNVPIPKDPHVSSPIAKESSVTPVPKSFELFANVAPVSSVVASEQNEEQVNAVVDGSDFEMADAVESKRIFSVPTDVVAALSVGRKGDGSITSSTIKEFGFAPSTLLVALPFLLLLVSSTDGLVLIPTDTSWLRNSSFIVASPVNTSAFRHSIRSSLSFGMANVCNLLSFLLILRRASLVSFVQLDSFVVSILVQASRMGCFSSASFGMNLQMAVSCRNKLRIWFELIGVGLRMIACILPGSTFSPSYVTIWQINLPSFTPNEDMV